MTVHHGCTSCLCDGGQQENFLYTENLTYKMDSLHNLQAADKAYLLYRKIMLTR
ncbi:MAG: hypothetical protein JWO06_1483 [Bacteroidota bacterium]|nr:hypothetical protein [Bacteroidota bacterium]